jgi:CheY-like chemotaxis protein
MRKLGLDIDAATVDSEIKHKFKAAFQGLMSASKQQALQILFSGEFDPADMDLDMTELDTMEA